MYVSIYLPAYSFYLYTILIHDWKCINLFLVLHFIHLSINLYISNFNTNYNGTKHHNHHSIFMENYSKKKKKAGSRSKLGFYNTKNDQILIIYGISSLAIVSYNEEVSNTQKIVYFRIIESR